MPRKRSAENVSTDELIQLVTCLTAEGEFPDVEPEGNDGDADGECGARKELNAARECLKQFSARHISDNLERAVSGMMKRGETLMGFVIRMRVQMLADEKGDSAKLQTLKWLEGIARALATSHVKVQERLDIRKPAGAIGNSVGNGSPYAMLLRQREETKARHGASKDLAGSEASPPC